MRADPQMGGDATSPRPPGIPVGSPVLEPIGDNFPTLQVLVAKHRWLGVRLWAISGPHLRGGICWCQSCWSGCTHPSSRGHCVKWRRITGGTVWGHTGEPSCRIQGGGPSPVQEGGTQARQKGGVRDDGRRLRHPAQVAAGRRCHGSCCCYQGTRGLRQGSWTPTSTWQARAQGRWLPKVGAGGRGPTVVV